MIIISLLLLLSLFITYLTGRLARCSVNNVASSTRRRAKRRSCVYLELMEVRESLEVRFEKNKITLLKNLTRSGYCPGPHSCPIPRIPSRHAHDRQRIADYSKQASLEIGKRLGSAYAWPREKNKRQFSLAYQNCLPTQWQYTWTRNNHFCVQTFSSAVWVKICNGLYRSLGYTD